MSLLRIIRGRGRTEGVTINVSDLLEAFPNFDFTGAYDISISAIDSLGIRHDLRFGKPKRDGTTIYMGNKNYPVSLPMPETGRNGERYLTVLRAEEIQ